MQKTFFANGTMFSEKRCREDIRMIELSLEKLRRNQGVSEQKYDELMQQAAV